MLGCVYVLVYGWGVVSSVMLSTMPALCGQYEGLSGSHETAADCVLSMHTLLLCFNWHTASLKPRTRQCCTCVLHMLGFGRLPHGCLGVGQWQTMTGMHCMAGHCTTLPSERLTVAPAPSGCTVLTHSTQELPPSGCMCRQAVTLTGAHNTLYNADPRANLLGATDSQLTTCAPA